MEMPATDLTPVLERLDALAAQVDRLARAQRAHDELIEELTPIAREATAAAIARLDRLERDGYVAFATEAAGVVRRVVEGFAPADVHQLGDSIVGMLEAVKAITQPDVLDARPIGMLGVARAARKDDDVRKGLAVMVEVLRRIGQRATRSGPTVATLPDRQARLAELLGPRRARPQLPAPAPAVPASPAPAPRAPTPTPTPAAPPAAARAPACAIAAPTATADPDWTRARGEQLAAGQGLALTAAHWAVLDAARADFAATQVSPNIRRLTQIAGVTTRDLYNLFPKAPGRTIAAIAGLPKPAGCL